MQKTIGGDRLGSGKRMKFHTKEFNRSTHNLSEIFRSTMSSGTLVPFFVLPALPGDTHDITLDCDIRTLPTVGPLFGSYKLQLDMFEIPMRLYNKDLMINKLEVGRDISKVKFPQITVTGNSPWIGLEYDYSNDTPWGGKEMANCQIEPSTLLSYLGMKGLGNGVADGERINLVTRQFNALPLLMYWDIYKQYYANKMEEIGYYIHNKLDTQNELIANSMLYVNNGDVDITVGIETGAIDVTSGEVIIMLAFNENWEYLAFNEEEFEMNVRYFFGSEYRNYQLRGSKDFIIQRQDSRLRIYMTTKPNTLIEHPMYFKIYSKLNYDYIRPNLEKFDLKNIDNMKDEIMAQASEIPFNVGEVSEAPYGSQFKGKFNTPALCYDITNLQCKQEGLGIKTYQSDKFNNWLNEEWIAGTNGVNAVTAIEVDEDGKFTLDELNIKKKVYEMLNQVELSGGTYDDWQDVIWGVQRNRQISSPVYIGGLSKEIIFEEVISNASIDESQPLGTLAGRGRMGNKHKGGKIVTKITEPSYIIGIASITPRIDYSSGNAWHTNLKNMGELHNPFLDQIAFQDLITDEMAFWDTNINDLNEITFKSAGKQPSWINYQTSYNKVYGNFALKNEQMFMVLNRNYEVGYTELDGYHIGDVTTYIDPQKFNHIFADTSADAMNFWVQISIEDEARRIMSANQIPNL